jgi:AraC family transcriptional regulator, transcriptional activator of pobA
MTIDRLNDHVKRAIGVSAGHLIRQRLMTEAKRSKLQTSRRSFRFPIPRTLPAFFASIPELRPAFFVVARGECSRS